jgi:hypothetical protein
MLRREHTMDVLNTITTYLNGHPLLWVALLFSIIVVVAAFARKALWGLLLLVLPIWFLLWTLWPGYWLISVFFWPFFLIGIVLWLGTRKILGKVLVALALVAALVAGYFSLGNEPSESKGSELVTCGVYHYALDTTQTIPNPDKEPGIPFAVGTPVVQRDETGIKSELQERRSCGADGKFDSTLLAQHYAEWSYQGFIEKAPITFDDVDAYAAKLATDGDLYRYTLTTVENLENTSAFSVEKVGKGLWSLYVVPDGHGGVITHQGSTSHKGTAAVFTRDGKTIKYRLECGFQVLHTGDNPPPTDLPVCKYGVNDEQLCEKSSDPADYPHLGDPAPTGEFTGDDPIAVETTTTSDSGVTDTATNDVGSETGGQAGGGATEVEHRDPPATEVHANDPVTDTNSEEIVNPFGG